MPTDSITLASSVCFLILRLSAHTRATEMSGNKSNTNNNGRSVCDKSQLLSEQSEAGTVATLHATDNLMSI